MTDYANLLNNIKKLLVKDSTHRLNSVVLLLKHPLIRDELIKRPVRRALLAERFNVFSALGLDRYENYHSRFLAYLLAPQSNHDQGSFFLERLLGYFREKNGRFPESAVAREENSRIVAEQFAEKYGRIDIVIHLANHMVIAIENKVDHFEGDGQLRGYRNWLDSLKPTIENSKFLIFLTPDGREPESAKDRHDGIVDLSVGYGDLVNWLDNCIIALPPTASRILTVLVQYQQLCRTIAGELDMTNIKEEIINLIRLPENLKAALEISTYLELEKKAIDEKFRKNVISELLAKLAREGITNWRASVEIKNGVFGIYYQTHFSQRSPNYMCGIEKLFNNGWFGWYRPQWKDSKILASVDSYALSQEMSKNGTKDAESWWVGWNTLDANFKRWDAETILLIDNDNRQTECPLAKALAEKIWEMFITYRLEIEALDSFKQAVNSSSTVSTVIVVPEADKAV